MNKTDLGKAIKKGNLDKNKAFLQSDIQNKPYSQPIHQAIKDPQLAIFRYDWMIGHKVQPSKKSDDNVMTLDVIKLKTKKKGHKKRKKKDSQEILTLTGLLNVDKVQNVSEEKPVSAEKPVTTEKPIVNVEPISAKIEEASDVESESNNETAPPTKRKSKTGKPKATKKKKTKTKKKKENPTSKKKKTKSKKKKSKGLNKTKSSSVLSAEQRLELNDFTTWLNSLNPSGESEILEFKPKAPQKKKGKKQKKAKKKDKISLKIDSSVKKKEEIVSESLAALYVKQGHNKKALKAYLKLSAANADKAEVYAPIIDKLKKKIK